MLETRGYNALWPDFLPGLAMAWAVLYLTYHFTWHLKSNCVDDTGDMTQMSLGSFASPSCVIYPLSTWRWLRQPEVAISADDTWLFHFLYSKKSSNQFNPHIAIFQKPNLYKQDWAEPVDLSEPVWKQHQRYRVAIEEKHRGPWGSPLVGWERQDRLED